MPRRKTFAMVLEAPGRLAPRKLPLPEIGPDDGLLRVEACGICGSDVEQLAGVLGTPTPVVPGHEPVGIVEAVGERAAARWGVAVGDRVAVETMLSCGSCLACLSGRYPLCPKRRIYSYVPLSEPPGLWGAYAQHLYLDPRAIVHRMDPALPAEIAVLFNPLGAGIRWAVELPALRPGDTLLVLGPGQRGLASVVAGREAGAGEILVTGLSRDAHKLDLARALGASRTIDVEREDVATVVRERTSGRGADVVVEVTPTATEPVAQALDLVAAGGTIVLAGVKGFRSVPDFVSDKIVVKEITLRGAIGVTASGYTRAIRLLEERRPELERMHTHRFALRDAEQAIRTLAGEVPGEDAIAVCLVPEGA